MLLTDWEVANAIIDGNQSLFEGADLSKIDWLEVTQLIQGLLGEEIEEMEESDPERDVAIQELYYNRVRARAVQFKVDLPELVQ